MLKQGPIINDEHMFHPELHTHSFEKNVQILKDGGVIAMPTETVYGLAARIDIPSAIQKIFETKKRPFFDPLIVHVNSIEMAKACVSEWSPIAQVLAEKFWPGPLTLILPKALHINPMITSGLESVGVRMPRHPLALELISTLGVPLAAPSANKFGRTSPSRAEHVWKEFNVLVDTDTHRHQPQEELSILDGGPCEVGIESTVLLVKQQQLSILRPGFVSEKEISEALTQAGLTFEFNKNVDKKESPGHMKHHYMPEKPLVLLKDPQNVYHHFPQRLLRSLHGEIIRLPDQWEGVHLKKPKHLRHGQELKLSVDPAVASREFYHQLRVCAETNCDFIYFTRKRFHQQPEWEALMERISKAASVTLPVKKDLQIDFDLLTTYRVCWKMIVFIIVISMYVLHSLLNRLVRKELSGRRELYKKTVSLYCRFFTWAMGMKIQVKNLPKNQKAYLLIGNHMGVLDILCLAAVKPTLFITSQEMRQTPGLGLLAEMGGCLFVNRLSRTGIQKEIQQIRKTLQQGHNVVLYPEGTSTNGEKVLPFKKSLITAAAGAVPILPMVINYRQVNGQPMHPKYRDFVCWYGDQGFLEALLRVLSLKSCHAEIEFLQELHVHSEDDRHHIAQTAHKMVAEKFVPIRSN